MLVRLRYQPPRPLYTFTERPYRSAGSTWVEPWIAVRVTVHVTLLYYTFVTVCYCTRHLTLLYICYCMLLYMSVHTQCRILLYVTCLAPKCFRTLGPELSGLSNPRYHESSELQTLALWGPLNKTLLRYSHGQCDPHSSLHRVLHTDTHCRHLTDRNITCISHMAQRLHMESSLTYKLHRDRSTFYLLQVNLEKFSLRTASMTCKTQNE